MQISKNTKYKDNEQNLFHLIPSNLTELLLHPYITHIKINSFYKTFHKRLAENPNELLFECSQMRYC